jgi:ABC-type Fe3+ transport system permease subunit
VLTIVVGTGTAWTVTTFTFPGRDALTWLLPLPLAIPTYIVAYVYVDILDALGPVQSTLRAIFGWRSAADYQVSEYTLARRRHPALQLRALSLCVPRCARDVSDPRPPL